MALLASDFDKSRFLNASNLTSEKKFRIKNVTVEALGDDKKRKPIAWFTNHEKGLILNATNRHTLQGAFGDDMGAWAGKIIVIFPTLVDMRGKMVPGLRVRIPPPKGAATATAAPKPAPSGNGAAAAPPQPASSAPSEQLDEFGQSQSADKPTIADELDDEIPFN
jgi:hypothetical protein